MAISFIQSKTASTNFTDVVTITWSSNTTSSNFIYLSFVTNNAQSVLSITDSQGNTYTSIGRRLFNSNTYSLDRYYAKNITGGTTPTITVTFNGNAHVSAIASEYSGIDISAPLDQSASAAGTSTTPSSGATATTTQATELVVGVTASNLGGGSQSYMVGSGYGNLTSLTSQTLTDIGIEDKTVSSTGAQTATFTFGTSASWGAAVDTFFAAGPSPAVSDSITASEAIGYYSETVFTKEAYSLLISPLVQLMTVASTSSSVAATFSATPTQGNLLVALVYANKAGSAVSISGWNLAVQQDFSTTLSTSLFYKTAGASESTTVTANANSATIMELQIFEYSGGLTTLDQTATEADTGVNVTTRLSGTTGATTNANELVVAAVGFNNDQGDNVTWTNVFTGRTTTAHLIEADKTANAIGTYDTRATWSTGVHAVGLIATFGASVGVNVSDNITISEAVAVRREYNINVSDTISVDDDTVFVRFEGVQTEDDITLTEAVSILLESNRTISDNITVTESSVVAPSILSASVTDTLTTSETSSVKLTIEVVVNDLINVTDSNGQTLTFNSSNEDDVTVSESLSHYSDQIDVMEYVQLQLQQGQGEVGVSDFEPISELIRLDLTIALSVADSTTISDSVDVLRNGARDISLVDNRLLDESGNPLLDEAGNFITDETPGGDIILSSESMMIGDQFNVQVMDTVTSTEAQSLLIPTLFLATSDPITTTESALVVIPFLLIAVSDNLSISDITAGVIPLNITTFDSVSVTEALSRLELSFINQSDTITLTEATGLLIPTLFITGSDLVTTSEAISAARVNANDRALTVQDAVTVTESITQQMSVNLTVNDTTTITETLTRVLESQINKSDLVTMTETISRQLSVALATTDIATAAESIQVVVPTLFINVSDSTSITESVQISISSGIIIAKLLALLGAG